MQIDVSELLKSPEGSILEKDIEAKLGDLDPEIELEKPITGKVRLIEYDGILAEFEIKTIFKLLCYRCASRFLKTFNIKFTQKYTFAENQRTRIISKEQDEDFLIKKDGEIDLWPAIRQEIILTIPMKILCRDKCKGLCPKCGQNLNIKICKCK
jgi:uncharacterized protein